MEKSTDLMKFTAPELEKMTLEEAVNLMKSRRSLTISRDERACIGKGSPYKKIVMKHNTKRPKFEMHLDDTGDSIEEYSEFQGVIIGYMPGRIQWNKSNVPNCYSVGGKYGTIGNECKVCEYAKWGEDNRPPTCSENMTLVIFTLIEGGAEIREMRMSRSALVPFKEYLRSLVAQNIASNEAITSFSLEAVKEKSSPQYYSIPVFEYKGSMLDVLKGDLLKQAVLATFEGVTKYSTTPPPEVSYNDNSEVVVPTVAAADRYTSRAVAVELVDTDEEEENDEIPF